jgi:hypothetical protein
MHLDLYINIEPISPTTPTGRVCVFGGGERAAEARGRIRVS